MKNRVIVNIKGKNIDNFLKRILKQRIALFKVKKISRKEVYITIDYRDYEKLENLKTIYDIEIIEYKGFLKLSNNLKKNHILIFISLFGFILLFFLTNIIFEIKVVYNEEETRNLITRELRLYGIDLYKPIKSFHQIEEIKKQILEKYKDKIEWLEIERIGTKYIVRLELRKLPHQKGENEFYHIVAKKDAVIKRIDAISGEKVREINDYVKKGDIIISGDIKLHDNLKGSISSTGDVYGEVWYEVSVEYPFIYKEEIVTGKTKTNYTINFLNYSFALFDFNPFENKRITRMNITQNNLIPLSFSKQKEEELTIIDEINTIDEAKDKAILLAKKRIEEALKEKEYIIDSKILSTSIKDSKIECVVFFTVYENITDYLKIEKEENNV